MPTIGAGTVYGSDADAAYAKGKIDYSLPSGPVGSNGTSHQPPPSFQPPDFNFDPGVMDALNQLGDINSQIDAYLKQAREQAIIKFGDPSLASMAGFGLDPQAGTFAQQNYLSGNADLARLDKQKEQARQAIINRLAAHGILFSGETGYQEGQNAQDYGNKVYDARSALLNYLNGIQNQALQQKTQARQMVTQAQQSAYNQALQQYLTSLLAYYAGGQNG